MRARALFFAAALTFGCGGQTGSDTGGTGSTSGSGGGSSGGASSGGGGSGGIDCSNVGCAMAPMCDEGCTAACGCCGCAEGSEEPAPGGMKRCTGGCYVFVPTKACGGLAGAACAADEWCDLPNGCGFPDAMGACKKRPQGCYADCPGVCGCDGKQYCNACTANAQGIDSGDDKSCLAGKPCSTDQECAAGLKCCYPCGIPGCQNQCTVPDASGACPMYP